jgi:HrpA-like RNA helicase
LYALKVLDENCKLTPFGNTLVEFPIEANLARILVASGDFGCSEEILTIVALLTVPSVWVSPKEFRATADKARMNFAVQEGDMLTLLNGKLFHNILFFIC